MYACLHVCVYVYVYAYVYMYVYVCMYACVYIYIGICVYVCILYLNIYCIYVGFWLNTHIFKWRTGSGDIKILFYLHKVPHAVTEVRACGTKSPAIVGKARYAFAQLANHKTVSLLNDHTRTVPTTTRLLGLILKVNVCGICKCGHPGSGIIICILYIWIYIVCMSGFYLIHTYSSEYENLLLPSQSMYVCKHTCIHVCMYVCMYVYVYVCMYVLMYVCMYICMYECMHVRMYICYCMYVYMCMYVCICLYIYMYVYMYVLMYDYIYVLFVCRGWLYKHRCKRTFWPHMFGFKPLLGLEPKAPIRPQLLVSHANHSATETSIKRMFNEPMIYVVTRNHAVHP